MAELYESFVCVRVTDMRGVDLARYTFDFDLTFAAVLARADGYIYHRFGGRDHESADGWLRMEALESVLKRTLEEHAIGSGPPAPIAAWKLG